jgi:iron(III) transport system substrate-binding protein
MNRRRIPLAILALLGFVLPGCGLTGDSEGVVRVYSGRHYDLEAAFQQFHDETGIDVEFLFGSDAELRERIEAEGEDTQADVYMTVDAGNLFLAAEHGVFQPLDSDILDEAIPGSLRDPDGLWYGLSQRLRTIAYDPEQVEPGELSTYEALGDPKWKGELCMRNSANVYTQSLVASLIAHHGEQRTLEIVRSWVDNDVQILGNDILILETIAEGGCSVGIVNHYYLARLLEDDPDFPVRLFFANQDGRGVHANVSGAGVTAHADDPELAQRLIEWLATTGQDAFVSGNHEYPANSGVAPEPLIAEEFGTDFQTDRLNAAEFGSLNAAAVRIMDEAGYE